MLSESDSFKKASIILLDGSARSRLYQETIGNQLLPLILNRKAAKDTTIPTLYVVLGYGDYFPASSHVVETVYFGGDPLKALEHAKGWSFEGGNLIRNSLHEAMAAALRILKNIRSITTTNLYIISTTMGYEAFHDEVRVRSKGPLQGLTMEDLLRELKTSHRTIIYYFMASSEGFLTMSSILERLFVEGKEVKIPSSGVPAGWLARIVVPEGQTQPLVSSSSSSSSSSASSINLPMAEDEAKATKSRSQIALENAVKSFLQGTVMKLPIKARGEAIKEQLESPAYSAEYKQLLLTIVRQNSSTTTKADPIVVPSPARNESNLKTIAPNQGNGNLVAPNTTSNRASVWQGRMAFRNQQMESYFDVVAHPIANPRSANPNYIPSLAEFHPEGWPPVLAISSFVTIQSPAVLNSVPLSKLVEFIPSVKSISGGPIDEETRQKNTEIAAGFRSILAGKHLVGLVRLGAPMAMLVAARPHQLVGMVINKSELGSVGVNPSRPAANIASTPPAMSTPLPVASTIAAGPINHHRAIRQTTPGLVTSGAHIVQPQPLGTMVVPQPPPPPSGGANAAQVAILAAMAEAQDTPLTPDAILRLHRPASASLESPTADLAPLLGPDVFNILSLDSSMGDLRDYGGNLSYDASRSLEDSMFGDI